jgi:ABC-type polar amino acid transport system ATPase subunit
MIFQNFNLFPHMTALDNIIFAQVHALKRPKVEARERGQQLLQRVGLGDKGDSKPPRLSGGQQQRVAIARALALEPEVMLVDEPTSAIDPELRVEVLKVLREVAESGMTMLIATHEMQFAKDVADHVLFLDGGRIAEEGASKQMLDAPQNDRTKQFLNAIREG